MPILDHLQRPCKDFSRSFVQEIDFDSWESIEHYLKILESRQPQLPLEWEAWLGDWDELECILSEEGARRYIAMTVNTADEVAGQAYSFFVEEIAPKLAPWNDLLQKKISSAPAFEQLPPFFDLWKRDLQTSLELFREENIALDTDIALETQAYQKVTGAQSVEFEGKTLTLAQMSPFLEDADRKRRENAWKAIAGRRIQDRSALDQHFENLFAKRLEISRNCGFESFVPYIFKAKGRYDYSPSDCRDFHQMVETLIVPLQKAIHRKRAAAMGLEKLRPWDTACDPYGRPALRPYAQTSELLDGAAQIFQKMDKTLGRLFQEMRDQNLLDLEARAGKAPGGYQCTLDEIRLPFIFMNAAGTLKDVFTLLHEAGHSFHLYFCRELGLRSYRDVPAEIAEVASMTMELFGMKYLDAFFGPEDLQRAITEHLEDIILLLPWVAAVDSFQHWLYSNPQHSRQERTDKWIEIAQKYGGEIDWSGLEEFQASSWQRQLHIFEVPFYYIEYGFAQIGALGLWKQFREDQEKALDNYHHALSRGSSIPLPKLYECAGLSFDFSPTAVSPLIDDLKPLLHLEH